MGTDGNVTYAFVAAEVPECITRPNPAALMLNVRLESGFKKVSSASVHVMK